MDQQDSSKEDLDSILVDSFDVIDVCNEIPTTSNEGGTCPEATHAPKFSWQSFYSQDIRNYNVFRLVQLPCSPNDCLDPLALMKFEYQLQNLIACAKHVEADYFNNSCCKLNYFKLINEKIIRMKTNVDKVYVDKIPEDEEKEGDVIINEEVESIVESAVESELEFETESELESEIESELESEIESEVQTLSTIDSKEFETNKEISELHYYIINL